MMDSFATSLRRRKFFCTDKEWSRSEEKRKRKTFLRVKVPERSQNDQVRKIASLLSVMEKKDEEKNCNSDVNSWEGKTVRLKKQGLEAIVTLQVLENTTVYFNKSKVCSERSSNCKEGELYFLKKTNLQKF